MVTLVTTLGTGSVDLYVQRLAQNLDVPKIYSDVYQKVAELFNFSLLSAKAIKAVWEDWRFIRMLNKLDGIIHLPNQHLGRYGLFLRCPYIITVHDIIRYFDLKGYGIFIHQPNLRDKLYLSLDYKGVKRAAKIITVSQITKHDLSRYLMIPEERISVVYEAVDHQVFRPVQRRLVDYPYLLFVGSEHPRKNFIGLLKAFSGLKTQDRFEELKLVKVGKAGGPEAEFRKRSLMAIRELGLEKEVVFTDYVAEEDLPAYYSAAECFILPSFYEGFGFPPLEAMACGCPVIVSNRSSLPEIAGEAAIQVNPDNVEEIAAAIHGVLVNRELRKALVKKGFQRAAEFTWKRAAEQTLEVYHEVENSLQTSEELYKTIQEVKTLPIYEYECSRCSLRFEVKQGFNDESKVFCHRCGGEAHRIFSPVPIFFKGPGFYVTDSAAEDRNRFNSKQDVSKPVDVAKRTEPAEENKGSALT